MPDFSSLTNIFNQYQDTSTNNTPNITHELLGGGVAFEACKAYEDKCAREGKPGSHPEAKEIIAGICGAIVDREFETKGLDFLDKEEAKRQAVQQAHACLNENDYGN